jgi:YVTN family beta-propeller protein
MTLQRVLEITEKAMFSRTALLGTACVVLLLVTSPVLVTEPGMRFGTNPDPGTLQRASPSPPSFLSRTPLFAGETLSARGPVADNPLTGTPPAGSDRPGVSATSPPKVVSIDVGYGPLTPTYDPDNGYIYVPNEESGNVSVIDGNTIVGSINVGVDPTAATYDSANGDVYVTDAGDSEVSVISGTTLVATIRAGVNPWSSVFDSQTGYIYVANDVAGFPRNVTIIDGLKAVGSVNVGSYSNSLVFDSGNGFIYVANSGTDNVSVIHGTKLAGTVSVGTDPVSLTYDEAKGYVYVSNLGSGSVTVINGTSIVGTVVVGGTPEGVVWDSENGYVYVPNAGSDNVTVINGTRTVADLLVGGGPSFATDDSGYVFVSDSDSTCVSVISGLAVVGTVPVGYYPEGSAYDSGNGYVYVANNGGSNVTAIYTWTSATFGENGLPMGVGWWVNVTGGPSVYSSGTNLSFVVPYGHYPFTVSAFDKTYSSPGGSFAANGTPVTETILFSRVTYPVTFISEGLPSLTNWSVTLGGVLRSSQASSITLQELNGTYAYSVGIVAGWTPSSLGGSIFVDGESVAKTILWTRTVYSVTFEEGGLPSGAGWWVNVTGGVSSYSDTITLSFEEPNGSYEFTVSSLDRTYAAPAGSVTIAATPVFDVLSFSRVTYTVTFAETGLASGADWSVSLDATQHTSATATVRFVEPNGSYPFTVAPVSGYEEGPASGTVTVTGANVTEEVVFTIIPPTTFLVTFSEDGLPSGTVWSVTFNGVPESGTGDLTFPGIGNGTYSFSVITVAGYTATPGSGSVLVSGPAAPLTIAFKAVGSSPPTSTFLGLPSAEGYGVLGGAIIAILVVVAVVVLMGRPRGKPPRAFAGAPLPPNRGGGS